MAEHISGEIRLLLEQLVDRFVVKGGKAPDVIESMQRELDEMKLAYEQDPDPADAPQFWRNHPTTGPAHRPLPTWCEHIRQIKQLHRHC